MVIYLFKGLVIKKVSLQIFFLFHQLHPFLTVILSIRHCLKLDISRVVDSNEFGRWVTFLLYFTVGFFNEDGSPFPKYCAAIFAFGIEVMNVYINFCSLLIFDPSYNGLLLDAISNEYNI